MASVIAHKTTKARKPHKCYWCAEPIEIGDVYRQWTWIDIKPEVVRVHSECGAAWDDAASGPDRHFYEDGVSFGEHSRGCACEWGLCHCGLNKPAIGAENTLAAG